MKIEDIETRFLEITQIDVDLSKENITKEDSDKQQQKTTKEKSKLYGQVYTPLYICDKMINLEINNMTPEKSSCDLCAGCGQFTIRILRKLYSKYPNMNIDNWLQYHHTFTELQAISCAKLLYIFGKNINLYAGDSMQMKKAQDNETGILFFNPNTDKWENNKSFNKFLNSNYSNNIKITAALFERVFKYYENIKNKNIKSKKNSK